MYSIAFTELGVWIGKCELRTRVETEAAFVVTLSTCQIEESLFIGEQRVEGAG